MQTSLARIVAFSLLTLAGVAGAQDRPKEPDFDPPDPVKYREGLMQNGNLRTQGTGEGFAWHAANGAETFLTAYEVYQDPRWLEEAEKYYDFYLGKLQKDPDGYEGWIGDPISRNGAELSTDAIVGDAILCAPLAGFVEIVKKDPKLAGKFGKTADRYEKLATRIIWEKWNKRNCYYQDAAGWGSYHTPGKLIDMKASKWVDAPSEMISDNLNKHYAAAHVLLRLWRATGNPEFKERVIKICGRAKVMWRYLPDEDRIVWNYWMPHGPYDIEGRAPKSWVAVHPDRPGYQAWEVSMWIEVYDSGLVFEQQDFERIIRTNHWMNNNGTWRSADGTSKAGELWTALARFDEPIRKQCEARLEKGGVSNQIERDHLKYVMQKAPGWKRMYVKDDSKVEVVKVPLQPGRSLTMTLAIPDSIEVADDGRTQLATQTRTPSPGKLKIELLDASGKEVLGTIKEIDVAADTEYNAPLWDGTNPKTGKKDLGEYKIRWTLGEESRVAPFWVKQGVARKKDGIAAIQPGETITLDFEEDPSKQLADLNQQLADAKRQYTPTHPAVQKVESQIEVVNRQMKAWSTEQAAPSAEQAHGGKQSLKVQSTAQFKFGQFDDLPVKVSMWVYDDGAKFGKASKNGGAWGITPASGDKFAVRNVWRGYLDGDNQYAWFNTGENQWFNPHPAGVKREKGWREWTFDFTDPKAVEVTVDGNPVKGLIPKFTPAGAISVYFLGGEGAALFVDDVKVEYPKK